MKIVYQCDNCRNVHPTKHWIFHCRFCEKEVCDDCMYGWSTCKECASSKTDEELKELQIDDE